MYHSTVVPSGQFSRAGLHSKSPSLVVQRASCNNKLYSTGAVGSKDLSANSSHNNSSGVQCAAKSTHKSPGKQFQA